jgi:hypothetical protein
VIDKNLFDLQLKFIFPDPDFVFQRSAVALAIPLAIASAVASAVTSAVLTLLSP